MVIRQFVVALLFLALSMCGGRYVHADRFQATPFSAIPSNSLEDLHSILESIVQYYDLPAMAAGVILDGKLSALGTAGVRKSGTRVQVTIDDPFHLGTCSQEMTRTLIAVLVDKGLLRWDSTLGELFPHFSEIMLPVYRTVTIEQLVNHCSGLPGNALPTGTREEDIYNLPGETAREQRLFYIEQILQIDPETQPGEQVTYSYAGYVVLGAAAEQATGIRWEDLMQTYLFDPLEMSSAGFGSMGTPGLVDAPWQHVFRNGKRAALGSDPGNDLPSVFSPAGRIHCSIGDWAKFVLFQVNGGSKDQDILSRNSILRLQPSLCPDLPSMTGRGSYAMGRNESTVSTLGSNGFSFSGTWVLPQRKFAVIVATNQYSDSAQEAVSDAIHALVLKYEPNSDIPFWSLLK